MDYDFILPFTVACIALALFAAYVGISSALIKVLSVTERLITLSIELFSLVIVASLDYLSWIITCTLKVATFEIAVTKETMRLITKRILVRPEGALGWLRFAIHLPCIPFAMVFAVVLSMVVVLFEPISVIHGDVLRFFKRNN